MAALKDGMASHHDEVASARGGIFADEVVGHVERLVKPVTRRDRVRIRLAGGGGAAVILTR